ncbi:cutinase family protein [Lentzea sp. NPDC003310]|uniref:cutinase family protein n=1 Tax=Lentzea sp. NPDC003310 TaxID=3154447 RepID=UPI0033A895AD
MSTRMRALIASFAFVVASTPIVASAAFAAPDCQQVLVVFARGSDEKPGAKTATKFHEALKTNFGSGIRQSFVELGDLDGDGAVDPGGYPAKDFWHWFGVDLSFDPDADFVLDGYKNSRATGRKELVKFLNERATLCRAQGEVVVLGGYSQGADVVGAALPLLSAEAQASIGYVALFGDPRFNSGLLGPAVWAHGDYTWPNLGGTLGSRVPYMPEALKDKVAAWCNKGDMICSLNPLDLRLNIDAHMAYPEKWMPEAANLIALKLRSVRPDLADDLVTTVIPIALRPTDKVDVAFVVDTTGSMGDDIANAQASINQVTSALFGLARSPQVALVDYKDFGDPYQARVVTPFTTDRAAFATAVSTLSASGGGNTPESVYSGLMTAFGLGWRDGALKLAITIGDAPAHNPEPGTGYTAAQVLARAFELDPVVINPIVVGGDPVAVASFTELAEGSKGKVFTAAGAGDVVQAIKDAANAFSLKPVPSAGGPYTAGIGETIHFTAAGSFDPEGAIVEYAWDFDGNGTVDERGPSPTAVHRYDAAYEGLASVTVKATDGDVAVGTAPVHVAADKHLPRPPGAPTSAQATSSGADTISLKWTPPANAGDAPVGGYRIYRDDDLLLGMTTAEDLGATIRGVPADREVKFSVEAVSRYGASDRATSNGVRAGAPTSTSPSTSATPSATTQSTTTPATPQSTPPPSKPGALSYTGASVLGLVAAALVLLALGGGAIVVARRRRS